MVVCYLISFGTIAVVPALLQIGSLLHLGKKRLFAAHARGCSGA